MPVPSAPPTAVTRPADLRSWHGLRTLGVNFGWLISEKLVRWAIGLFVAALVARHLGPENFGRLNLAIAVVALFASLAGAGIETILTREIVRAPGQAAEIIATVAALRVGAGIAAAVLGLILLLAAGQLGGPALPYGLIAILSSGLILQVGEVFELWFQSQLKAGHAVLTKTVSFVVVSGVRLALVAWDAPVEAFAAAHACEAALVAGGMALLYLGTGRAPGRWHFVAPRARALLREAWPNLLSVLAIAIYMRIDRLILSRVTSEATVGLYGAAASIAELWYLLPSALIVTLTPALTRAHRQDPATYWRRLHQLVQGLAVLGWGILLLLGLTAKWVVALLFGAAFSEAATLLPVLLAATLFAFVGVGVSPWYLNEGAMLLALRRHAAGALVALVLIPLLATRWGALGTAWATTAAFATAHWLGNLFDARTRPLFYLQTRALCFRSLSELKPSALLPP